jgi:mannitol/fructose-specific phosphotransferase system IIA component (Ntr-type)
MTILSLPSILDSSLYIPELKSRRRESVVAEMVACAQRAGTVRQPDALRDLLALRERLGSTAVGKGVAVPNARSLAVTRPCLVVARSRRGIDWGAADEAPVSLVFLALSPGEVSESTHHHLLSGVVGVARYQRNRTRLLDATTFEVVSGVLKEALA